MKNLNARSFLFVMLVAASLFSYVYLNSVSIPGNVSGSIEEVETETLEEQPQEMLLPDVRFLKKVVETGKRFLPAS